MSALEASPWPVELGSLRQASGWLGARVDPRALDGRVTLVAFFAHDCPRSGVVLRALAGVHARHGPRGLTVVGVHEPAFGADVSREVARSMAAAGARFPVALDARGAIWDAFRTSLWPSCYLVDRDGALRGAVIGEKRLDRLESDVARLLSAS